MTMNKKEFFKTEFGAELECTVKALDIALEERAKSGNHNFQEIRRTSKAINELMARLDVYKQGLRTFYGLDLHFTRTDEYFGLCTEDESYYLMKEERGQKEVDMC